MSIFIAILIVGFFFVIFDVINNERGHYEGISTFSILIVCIGAVGIVGNFLLGKL